MLDSILTSGLTLPTFLICTAASLILGLLTALVCMYRQRCSRGFAVTLAILPAMVQMVILLVNGNIGAGVAVAGAFSLVRFRSVPGTAREIGAIFLAMAIGLATGMGYVALAAIFFVIVAAALLALTAMSFGDRSPRHGGQGTGADPAHRGGAPHHLSDGDPQHGTGPVSGQPHPDDGGGLHCAGCLRDRAGGAHGQ